MFNFIWTARVAKQTTILSWTLIYSDIAGKTFPTIFHLLDMKMSGLWNNELINICVYQQQRPLLMKFIRVDLDRYD